MISYSDNEATALIQKNLDFKEVLKTFTDLGLPKPADDASLFRITVKDYSEFMEVLYESGYLTCKDSEFAISLLNKAEFKEGIQAGIPSNVMIAHKYGERGDLQTNIHQLHETAIVYYKKSPYLITIMSKGPDIKNLTSLLREISETTYDSMVKNN